MTMKITDMKANLGYLGFSLPGLNTAQAQAEAAAKANALPFPAPTVFQFDDATAKAIQDAVQRAWDNNDPGSPAAYNAAKSIGDMLVEKAIAAKKATAVIAAASAATQVVNNATENPNTGTPAAPGPGADKPASAIPPAGSKTPAAGRNKTMLILGGAAVFLGGVLAIQKLRK